MEATTPGNPSKAAAAPHASPRPETWFAPAERLSPEELREVSHSAAENSLVRVILESVGAYVFILDRRRQILSASREVLDALGLATTAPLIGLRTGEALGCPNAAEGPGGCGTSRNCRWCGSVLATLAALSEERPSVGECCLRMSTPKGEETKDFSVKATPFAVLGQKLVALVLRDVSSERRRQVLERVFLHDLSNATQALLGWGDLFDSDPEKAAARIVRISEYLTREIEGQRLLRSAESGDLKPQVEDVAVAELFGTLQSLATTNSRPTDPILLLQPHEPEAVVRTDMALLLRVLLNMVKNAMEASGPGEKVRVTFEQTEEGPTFSVKNPGVVPQEAADRIFERSFSTKKGRGRGIGTYSMRLLGEIYLGGRVWFTSDEREGTVFRIALPPRQLGAARAAGNRA